MALILTTPAATQHGPAVATATSSRGTVIRSGTGTGTVPGVCRWQRGPEHSDGNSSGQDRMFCDDETIPGGKIIPGEWAAVPPPATSTCRSAGLACK